MTIIAASSETEILRWSTLVDQPRLLPLLDEIFFEASLTKAFADVRARQAFRERWLGRYLDRLPHLAHVAIARDRDAIGYIVGSHRDASADPLFADIGFYSAWRELAARYPAHLHINMARGTRGLGIGSRLIAAFEEDVRRAGLPGLHLVTGRDSRNRSFYARNGFECAAELEWAGTPIVFLAKAT